ncbi:hypothetical protein [Neptuniibacter sp.]|uniref:hypothetical protein n=1 Tax=Neptuniibacter sp. TaxID=1962643 RepID=UPI002632FFE5|nr:hypothetical protein [Neptuniibacter sp.]MCP4597015.1 hypothetical protein [Neptuniibacter sp.]
MKNNKWWYLKTKDLIFIVALTGIMGYVCGFVCAKNAYPAETEVTAQYGYKFAGMNSHKTFLHKMSDTELSGWCWQIGVTEWFRNFGVYGKYGEDRGISKYPMEGYKYSASTYWWGLGLKYRFRGDNGLRKVLYPYVGAGLCDATLKNRVPGGSEKLSAYGPEAIVGYQWDFGLNSGVDSDHFGLNLEMNYSSYPMESEIFRKTKWKPGGLRVFTGVSGRF